MIDKKRIMVVFGGASSEHEVSRKSAFSILKNLNKDKYDVVTVGITKAGHWLLTEACYDDIKSGEWENHPSNKTVTLNVDMGKSQLIFLDGDNYHTEDIDCLWPVLHGKNGEDGTIQGLCELAGVKFVGPDTCSSALCMDKAYTKIVVNSRGINQAKYLAMITSDFHGDEENCLNRIDEYFDTYPLFVKPARAGSSVGITKVNEKAELLNAIEIAFCEDSKIVVEEGIFGKEVEISVLGNEHPKASCVGEIIPEASWYDYEAKYNSTVSRTIIPADLEESVVKEIQETAVEIYKLLGCSGLSRVDFFVTEDNRVVFNEVNTLPGFTEISMYPKLWEASGLPYTELLDEILECAFNR
ncbi:MAG: D-alanine--D-alanine ligase [Firmicutes bacterium]|nr:D-alanine--D-alanine ligase [Bacillota bacterium]